MSASATVIAAGWVGFLVVVVAPARANPSVKDQVEREMNQALVAPMLEAVLKRCQGFRIGEKEMADQMLRNPLANKGRQQSERNLRQRYLDQVRRQFHSIESELVRKTNPDPVVWKAVKVDMFGKDGSGLERKFGDIAKSQFDPVYPGARKLAVEAQRNRFKLRIWPSEQEICRIQEGQLTEAQLVAHIEASNGIDSLFEENASLGQERIGHSVSTGLEEYHVQSRLLANIELEKAYTSEDIKSELTGRLRQKVQGLAREPGARQYQVLPCLLAGIGKLAEEMERNRFDRFMQERLSKAAAREVTRSGLLEALSGNPGAHKGKAASDSLLAAGYSRSVDAVLQGEYLAAAGLVGDKSAGERVRIWYAGRHAHETAREIAKLTAEMTSSLRDSISRADMGRDFGHLSSQGELTESEVVEFAKLGDPERVNKWRELGERETARRGRQYLEETENSIRAAIQGMYEQGEKAYSRQTRLPADIRPGIDDHDEYQGYRSSKAKEKMFAFYLHNVEANWSRMARSEFSGRYQQVFERTKEIINDIITEDMQEVVIPNPKSSRVAEKENEKSKHAEGHEGSTGGATIGLGGIGSGGGKGDGVGAGIGGGGGGAGGAGGDHGAGGWKPKPCPEPSASGYETRPAFRISPLALIAKPSSVQVLLGSKVIVGDSAFMHIFDEGYGADIRLGYGQFANGSIFLQAGLARFTGRDGDNLMLAIPFLIGALGHVPFGDGGDLQISFSGGLSTCLLLISMREAPISTPRDKNRDAVLVGVPLGLELSKRIGDGSVVGLGLGITINFFPRSAGLASTDLTNFHLLALGLSWSRRI